MQPYRFIEPPLFDRFGHITAGTYNTAGQLLQMKFTSADGAESSCYDYGYLAAGENSKNVKNETEYN